MFSSCKLTPQGRGFCPSAPLWWDPTGSPASSSGALRTGQTWTCWSRNRGGHRNEPRAGTALLWRQAERVGAVQPREETGLWETWSSCRCPCSLQGGWTRWSLKVPSNPNYSMILLKYNWDDTDTIQVAQVQTCGRGHTWNRELAAQIVLVSQNTEFLQTSPRYLQCNKTIQSAFRVSCRGKTGRQVTQLGSIATAEYCNQ